MKTLTYLIAATFLAGSVVGASAMMRSSGMNPDYKFGPPKKKAVSTEAMPTTDGTPMKRARKHAH